MDLHITKAHIKPKTTKIDTTIATYALEDCFFAASELASIFVPTFC